MTYLTRDQFEKYLRVMKETPNLTIDTEGTLNHPFSTTWGLSASSQGTSDYFAFNHQFGNNLPQEWLPELKEVVYSRSALTMHGAKHDLRAMRSLFGEMYMGKFYCTMLMSHMTNENLYAQKLDSVSRHYGGQPKSMPPEMKMIIDVFGWQYVPVDMMRAYADNDAFITEELRDTIYPDFVSQEFDGDLWDVEQDFVRLLMKMEDTGVLVDQDLCEQELKRGLGIMRELEKSLGFNPNSPKQLSKFLLDDLRLPVVKRTKKGRPSFDKEAMEVYDELLQLTNDTRARQVLTYRGWMKTTSSNYKPYLELLYPDGRLRPNYKQHGTKTGRLSCSEPNLQQIPKTSENDWNGKLKAAFITAQGRTPWEIDYSQLEFRLGAAYAKEQRLIEVFNDPTRDIFEEMAFDLGMTRDRTKRLNYTLQFGGGITRIKDIFGLSAMAAEAVINNYFSKYRGLKRMAEYAEDKARQRGYVRYWTGRRRHFQYPKEYRKAFNAACQGGGFEITKRRMIALDKAGLINDECQLDLQVHDAMRLDIENGKEDIYLPEVKRVLENVEEDYNFGVEFPVDIHKWGTKEKYAKAA